MLTLEVAKARLAEWQLDRSETDTDQANARRTRVLTRMRGLAAPTRAVAFALTGYSEDGQRHGNDDWAAERLAFATAARQLDELSPDELRAVFEAFLPGLTPLVADTFQFLKRLPCQDYGGRKPFRSFRDRHTAVGRARWLDNMRQSLEIYRPDILTPAWLAAWAPYLGRHSRAPCNEDVAYLLASVIDGGGLEAHEVLEILQASATNEHEVGSMGRHVPRALLTCSNPDAWEFIEKLLLAAQRQEGLRQVILQTVDEAHPEAFRRMVRLILEHDLVRFSSVVQAVNGWVSLAWDSASAGVIKKSLESILLYLDDEVARDAAIEGKDAQETFFGLWAVAFDDVGAAIQRAAPLATHKKAETRFAAVTFLCHAGVEECATALAQAAKDDDLRVALLALRGLPPLDAEQDAALIHDVFATMEAIVRRLPKEPVDLKPLVWPWMSLRADRESVAPRLKDMLGTRSPLELVPYFPMLGGYHRVAAFNRITDQPSLNAATRKVVVDCTADATLGPHALEVLEKLRITQNEAIAIEKLLTRKAADTRRGALSLLVSQSDDDAQTSADRLVAAGNVEQRLGGLELLRLLAAAGRNTATCQEKAAAFAKGRKKLSKEEQTHVTAIADASDAKWSLDDALGLMDPTALTPRMPPLPQPVTFFTDAAYRCIESLDALIHEHRADEVRSEAEEQREGGGQREGSPKLLGEVGWSFRSVDYGKSAEEAAKELPLRAVWEAWWSERPADLRDRDELELLRAVILMDVRVRDDDGWNESLEHPAARDAAAAMHALAPLKELRYPPVVGNVLKWLNYLHPAKGTSDYLLNAAEASLAMVPRELLGQPRPEESAKKRESYWSRPRDLWHEWGPFTAWKSEAEGHFHRRGEGWTLEQNRRLWQLQHWQDIPAPGEPRSRPDFSLTLLMRRENLANDYDVLDHLLGPRATPLPLGRESPRHGSSAGFSALSDATEGSSKKVLAAECPALTTLVDRCRDRILEIELARGETPTVATGPALALRSLDGIAALVRVCTEMNKGKLGMASYSWESDGQTRGSTFTHLLRITCPLGDETPAMFAKAVSPLRKQGVLTDERLLELAFLAPQWLASVEESLRWKGLREGVYWYLAHMAYSAKGVLDQTDPAHLGESDKAARLTRRASVFDRIVAERTPLTDAQRLEGGVDVGWFRKAHAAVGAKRWQMIAEAAKQASSPQQANKAEHLGQVVLGKASRTAIVRDIRTKRLKHSVRLLGLLPLPEGTKRTPELVARYRVITEYQRYARGLSAMTKPDAMRSVEIGLANLASTAGYPDALRMTWALEAEGLADLRQGVANATAEGVTVSLAIGADHVPSVTYAKGGKPLKTCPATVKKNKKVNELLERASQLKRQAPRMKASLETMMCRGDEFTGSELRELAEHPLLWPQLSRLVLMGDGVLGYPDMHGQVLRDHAGALEPVKKTERLRIAHPLDLYESTQWPAWQRDCFAAECVQPCKQVFRELYVLTKTERSDKLRSRRYAGQQIHPRQAMALFGARGWRTQDGVEKIFHDAEILASVGFVAGWGSPLDVEGLTLNSITFYRRDQYEPVPLAEVPQRIFSEVMRDLDLVVSVAHRSGVDPEVTASTVEMRISLLRETCTLMGIKNVTFKSTHAVVKGKLGDYSVHLGSGVIHRMPGGALWIVAVGAQHRGRLFLPFADDDPRTAEVIAKVLLLARDESIQDPTILEQIQR